MIPEQCELLFYRSILIGDVADNIKGIYGIGPAKAAKILPSWQGEEDAIKRVIKAYMEAAQKNKENPHTAIELIRQNGRLLKIKQEENEPLWDSPYLKQMEDQISEFILPTVGASSPSTEPITQEMTASAG